MTTPSWQINVPFDAVIFDCDGTLSTIEGIDELARTNGVGHEVEALTAKAMNTTGVSIELYQQRLNIVKPQLAQVTALGQIYIDHLSPDANSVIQCLQLLNKPIYIVSAGLTIAVQAVGAALDIPPEHIFAVNTQFDAHGNYLDFDHHSPLVTRTGKRDIVTMLKKQHPRLLYIGDGLNDFEVYDLVTRFIGYGGAFYREHLAKKCEFYIKTASMAPIIPLALTTEEQSLVMRIRLLKAAAPFAELPAERLQQLAEKVTSLSVNKDTIICRQGAPGDACYLIESGSVEISIQTRGTSKILNILKTPDVFGESALLLDLPRNATARALEDTTLLVLSKAVFLDLIHAESNTAESLLMLQQVRSRPSHLAHVETHAHMTADGETITTLKNTDTNKYYRLNDHGLFIWNKLDGAHSLSDITLDFYNQFKIFNPGLISMLILDLHRSHFIQLDKKHSEHNHAKPSFLMSSYQLLNKCLNVKWTMSNVDPWLTHTYERYIWPFFTRTGQLLLLLLACSGLGCFILQFAHTADLLNTASNKWSLVIMAYCLSFAAVILHELAHAYTTKAFGHEVHGFGIGWFWFGPMAFCDTSDMWLAPKNARIAVDFAGIYLNLILAGMAGWCLYLIAQPDIMIVLWLFALINYISVIANLSPAIELDGYYMLMDILDKPNLRQSAVAWLADVVFGHHTAQARSHTKEIIYWIVTIVYLILLEIILPFILAVYLLHGLFDIHNWYVSVPIVLLVVILSSSNLWLELQQRRHYLLPNRPPK